MRNEVFLSDSNLINLMGKGKNMLVLDLGVARIASSSGGL